MIPRLLEALTVVPPMGHLASPAQGGPPAAPVHPAVPDHDVKPLLLRLVGRHRRGVHPVGGPELIDPVKGKALAEPAPLQIVEALIVALVEIPTGLVDSAMPEGRGLGDGIVAALPRRQQ